MTVVSVYSPNESGKFEKVKLTVDEISEDEAYGLQKQCLKERRLVWIVIRNETNS
jgi:hypothetical protein